MVPPLGEHIISLRAAAAHPVTPHLPTATERMGRRAAGDRGWDPRNKMHITITIYMNVSVGDFSRKYAKVKFPIIVGFWILPFI